MKFVLVFSLAVLCAAVLQPTEAAKTQSQPPNQLSFWKHPIDFTKVKFEKVKKYVKDLAKKVWLKVEKGIEFLKKSAADLWPLVENKVKDRVTSFKTDVDKLLTSTKKKKLSDKVKDKVHEKLYQVALYVLSADKTGEEIARTVENDLRAIRDLETQLLATIQSGPDMNPKNPCIVDGKNQALALKNDNLGKYAACKSHAYEAIKTVGEFLFNTAVILGPKVLAAAGLLAKAQLSPLFYGPFALALGNIVFTGLPKVFAAGKLEFANIKKAAQEGSQCIIDKFNESKKAWNLLSEKLASC